MRIIDEAAPIPDPLPEPWTGDESGFGIVFIDEGKRPTLWGGSTSNLDVMCPLDGDDEGKRE